MLNGAAHEPGDLEAEADSVEAFDTLDKQKAKQPPSVWQRFLNILGASSNDEDELDHQIRTLTIAIEMYPDSPTNYVMRGEKHLQRRDYHLANADFERAIQLSEAELDQQEWGIVAQVMLDRAQQGLAKAAQYLDG